MRGPSIALFILALPLIEIAAFVVVGRQIGVLATVGLVIASSIAGSMLLRFQGFGVLARIASETKAGRDPSRDLAHGVMILIAGILLLIPGFVTDVIGILLFIPPVRDLGWRYLRSRLNFSGNFTVFRAGFPPRGPTGRGDTIDLDEADYTITPPKTGPKPRIDGER